MYAKQEDGVDGDILFKEKSFVLITVILVEHKGSNGIVFLEEKDSAKGGINISTTFEEGVVVKTPTEGIEDDSIYAEENIVVVTLSIYRREADDVVKATSRPKSKEVVTCVIVTVSVKDIIKGRIILSSREITVTIRLNGKTV